MINKVERREERCHMMSWMRWICPVNRRRKMEKERFFREKNKKKRAMMNRLMGKKATTQNRRKMIRMIKMRIRMTRNRNHNP